MKFPLKRRSVTHILLFSTYLNVISICIDGSNEQGLSTKRDAVWLSPTDEGTTSSSHTATELTSSNSLLRTHPSNTAGQKPELESRFCTRRRHVPAGCATCSRK